MRYISIDVINSCILLQYTKIISFSKYWSNSLSLFCHKNVVPDDNKCLLFNHGPRTASLVFWHKSNTKSKMNQSINQTLNHFVLPGLVFQGCHHLPSINILLQTIAYFECSESNFCPSVLKFRGFDSGCGFITLNFNCSTPTQAQALPI